jgi:hypothetical protein
MSPASPDSSIGRPNSSCSRLWILIASISESTTQYSDTPMRSRSVQKMRGCQTEDVADLQPVNR